MHCHTNICHVNNTRLNKDNLFTVPMASREDSSGRFSTAGKILAIGALTAALAACGSTPVDEAEYTRVQTQISEAKEMPTAQRSKSEIFSAESKLEQARKADKSGDRKQALRLLREAELHAQLAEARALTAIQQASLKEINEGLDTLRRKID